MINYCIKKNALKGSMRPSSDKSISHRALIFGSLAEGVTEIEHLLEGEDVHATRAAFQAMGVQIEKINETWRVYGKGLNGLRPPQGDLYLGNSGTSMRLLSGLLAAQPFNSTLTGDASLMSRPMGRVASPLIEMGAKMILNDDKAPIQITGNQNLHGIHYVMPVASAQVKSCLLLAGLYAEDVTEIIESERTRDHTERMLRQFGANIHRENDKITLSKTDILQAQKINVPVDFSTAAFFIVGATIAQGSDIVLKQAGINPYRTGLLTILNLMGANIELNNQRLQGEEPVADIRVHYAPLKGINVPVDQISLAIDECPALFVAAACAQGETVFKGAKELRAKESDRIDAMAAGLRNLGIELETLPDGIIIQGGNFKGGIVESFDDHRIAMALSLAGLVSQEAVIVKNADCVSVSCPDFVGLAGELGMGVELK